MNTIIFFLAGVSIGLATDKLYHSLFASRKNADDMDKDEGASEEKAPAAEKPAVKGRNEESRVARIKEVSTRSEEVSSGGEGSQDDLSQIKGVGPKLAGALHEAGIHSHEELANSSADRLFEKLREAGKKFNRTAILSVVERAQLAVNEKKSQ
jgi:predicted flap endonuclease-1-like 5' DNA nuclease